MKCTMFRYRLSGAEPTYQREEWIPGSRIRPTSVRSIRRSLVRDWHKLGIKVIAFEVIA